MRKYAIVLFLSALLSFSGKTMAQQDTTLAQKISREFCEEFSKKDFARFSGSEMEIGLIILPIVLKYKNEIEKEWKLSPDNEEDFEKIGERVGAEAALTCPKFQEFIRSNLSEITAMDEDKELKSVSGTLQRIEENFFQVLTVKTKSGKEERLWWFQFFEGSEELLDNPNKLLKKNIKIKYTEMEVYDPKLKDYRKIKVIRGLEKE